MFNEYQRLRRWNDSRQALTYVSQTRETLLRIAKSRDLLTKKRDDASSRVVLPEDTSLQAKIT